MNIMQLNSIMLMSIQHLINKYLRECSIRPIVPNYCNNERCLKKTLLPMESYTFAWLQKVNHILDPERFQLLGGFSNERG
jgi:CRISPR/Cas system-associated endonuclease Cas1